MRVQGVLNIEAGKRNGDTYTERGRHSKPRNEYRYSREVEAAARDQAVRKQVPIAPITPGTDTDRVEEGCSRVPGGVQPTRGPLDCQQELREPSLHATRERCVDRRSEDLEGPRSDLGEDGIRNS